MDGSVYQRQNTDSLDSCEERLQNTSYIKNCRWDCIFWHSEDKESPMLMAKIIRMESRWDFGISREYVLWRDGHTCQHCHGKSEEIRFSMYTTLNQERLEAIAKATLSHCAEPCHKTYHRGKFELKVKRGTSFRDSAFMGIMRWAFLERLKQMYSNVSLWHSDISLRIPYC